LFFLRVRVSLAALESEMAVLVRELEAASPAAPGRLPDGCSGASSRRMLTPHPNRSGCRLAVASKTVNIIPREV
jgi:hypothetical protein